MSINHMNFLRQISLFVIVIVFLMHPSAVEAKSLFGIFSGKKNLDYQQLFQDVYQKIKDEYVEETPDKKLIEAALAGMLSSLDPYSTFLDEKDTQAILDATTGEFSGIAVEVTLEKGRLKVISPYEDGPAFKAGVRAGDIINSIDKEPTYGRTLSNLADSLKGTAGTVVHLTIMREGLDIPLEVKIKREVIKLITVSSKLIDDNIIYININTFNAKTSDEIEQQYNLRSKQTDKLIKGLIIDMRWNPGGLFDQAVETSNLFLVPGQPIVSVRGRSAESYQEYYADGRDITEGLPIVLLVNEGTASAPEIVIGALQGNKRAIVVGTKTFGKASMQSVIPISEHTAIKFTTAKYYTPEGNSIHGVGLIPDIVVNGSNEETNKESKTSFKKNHKFVDSQMRRAIEVIQQDYFKPLNQ
jgi:carboxyl-terminal processing protease